ncbi:folliculin-like isoform X2 [Tubulanus polymorphus]
MLNHTKVKTADLCEACRSLEPTQPGFISNDHEAKVSYVSNQYPDHPQVFSMVRQACVRSLSCEVCPGREGPFFFGDDSRGHVFSHTFYIKDSHARGLSRWYSILVVMMDKIYLLNSWPFLVQHIREIIDHLQEKASKVYEEEQAKCPQRAHRLAVSMNPANFRQHRGENKPARSLIELTRDKNIFSQLHLRFTWILKACSNRLTEKLLEGPPTEDSIVDLEKQEETDEGFIKVFTKKMSVTDTSDIESNCNEEQPYFNNLQHMLKVLGYQKFHLLAHHVVIGNQIILRSNNRNLVRSIIDCLKMLLPKGCCQILYYSDQYQDSWRCSFLGLYPDTVIPAHVLRTELYLLMDIKQSHHIENPDVNQLIYSLHSQAQLPERGPTVLSKMEAALMNDKLSNEVIVQCLICQKEEWMNKVKVLFMFTKAGGNRTEDETKKLLQVLGAQEEDRRVLKYWMTGLSVQYKTHMLSASMSQGQAAASGT